MLDNLEKIVEKAIERKTDYAEARLHKNEDKTISMRNGTLIGTGYSLTEGVGIRVLVSGSLGFSATNNIGWNGLEKALDEAIAKARASSNYLKKPVVMAPERSHKASYSAIEKSKPDSISMEDKLEYLKGYWTRVKDSLTKAKVTALFVVYEESVEEKTFVNSEGSLITSRIPRIGIFYNLSVKGTGGEGANRWQEYSASGGIELLDEWKVEERIVEQARVLENVLEKAKTIPAGKYDVVLGSEIVGLMVHESCGHPMEADRILGREAAQAGESFIKKDMLGERIGSEKVTVIDDPTIPGSNGFYLYDDEGVKARARYLYKDGVINEFLHNRETAAELGTQSNGAARAMDYNSEPIVRMANTYFMPGDRNEEELIEELKDGLYVKTYMEWNIDDRRWGQRYVGLEAYRVKNGETKELIKNPALEFTTGEIYSKVESVGKNLEFYAGLCGKGEPGQGVPVWFGGPSILLRGLRVR